MVHFPLCSAGHRPVGRTAVSAGPSETMLHASLSVWRHLVALLAPCYSQRAGPDLLYRSRCKRKQASPTGPSLHEIPLSIINKKKVVYVLTCSLAKRKPHQ